MLDYIKSQLKERGAQIKAKQEKTYAIEEDPVVLVEYAHLFQELDELTVDGSEDGQIRKISSIIDIPVEEDDDLEIESIEMNLSDGRIMDVPMDATVTEYQLMKTFDDFYQEAFGKITMLPRESNVDYRERVKQRAESDFKVYQESIAAKGLFGSDKISIGDSSVPDKTLVNFGDIAMKLPISYEADNQYRITKKQIDSLNYAKNHNVFQHLAEPLMQRVKRKMNVPDNTSLWDIITPKSIMLAKGPADKYCFVLEYAYDQLNELDYFGWSTSVSKDIENAMITESMVDEILGNFAHYETKDSYHQYIQESSFLNKREIGRFAKGKNIFQEAIDFGGGADAGTDLPPDPNANAAPAPDPNAAPMGTGAPSVDAGAGGADTTANNGTPDANGDNKEEVDTNNVSDQIAEKVADKTQNQDNPIEDMEFNDADLDTGNSSEEDDAVINDKLSELDNDLSEEGAGEMTELGDEDTTEDDELGNINADDIENMSIEEIVAQGSEKLKSMTLSELKAFLSDDVTSVQEG